MKKLCVLFIICSSIFLAGCSLLPVKNETQTTTSTQVPTVVQNVENPILTLAEKTGTTSAAVPLPTGQDIVRIFFNLINEKRIPEAVSMLDVSAVSDDSAKQAWGVQFNYISQVIVKSIEDYNKTEWIPTEQTFKVTLTMNSILLLFSAKIWILCGIV